MADAAALGVAAAAGVDQQPLPGEASDEEEEDDDSTGFDDSDEGGSSDFSSSFDLSESESEFHRLEAGDHAATCVTRHHGDLVLRPERSPAASCSP